MKPFREFHASDLATCSLTDEMNTYGYLYIRDLLPADDLQWLLAQITHIVSDAHWLTPGHPPLKRIAKIDATCGDPDPSFTRVYEKIFSLENFHALTHNPALQQVMKSLVGPQLLVHPKPIARLIFPNCEELLIRAHQDYRGIGGDFETFTAWFPLHDCPIDLGPLQILEGSHRFGLQNTGSQPGFIPLDLAQGGDWVGGNINAGDVIIFHSLTVHTGSPNISNQLRISMDCRFQNATRPIDPSALVFPGDSESEMSWEKTYANWHSDELQYLWKQWPLQFNPSIPELTQLAQTADSERMRTRYTRILDQIEAQLAASF